jgi:hypothetical protein
LDLGDTVDPEVDEFNGDDLPDWEIEDRRFAPAEDVNEPGYRSSL